MSVLNFCQYGQYLNDSHVFKSPTALSVYHFVFISLYFLKWRVPMFNLHIFTLVIPWCLLNYRVEAGEMSQQVKALAAQA